MSYITQNATISYVVLANQQVSPSPSCMHFIRWEIPNLDIIPRLSPAATAARPPS